TRSGLRRVSKAKDAHGTFRDARRGGLRSRVPCLVTGVLYYRPDTVRGWWLDCALIGVIRAVSPSLRSLWRWHARRCQFPVTGARLGVTADGLGGYANLIGLRRVAGEPM